MSTRSKEAQAEFEQKVFTMTRFDEMSAADIARELKCATRTVHRTRTRLGISQAKAREATPEELAWIDKVRAEGMPATWIAETVRLKRDAVQRRSRMPEGAREEWLVVWQSIRRNPVLLALHQEFANGPVEMEAAA